MCDYLSPDLKMMKLKRMKGSIIAQWTNLQQVYVTDGKRLCYAKNWTRTPSASGSYGRPAVHQAGRQKLLI